MSRTVLVLACGCALIVAWWLGQASADEEKSAEPATPVALAFIDVAKVFTASPRLARLREDLQSDLEAESGAVKALNGKLEVLANRAGPAKDDQDDLKRLHEELERTKGELAAEKEKLRSRYVAKEVEMFRSFYDDVRAEVERYAKDRKIRLVIRFQAEFDPPTSVESPEDAQKILNEVNQLVVYHDSLDITDAVIERMRASGSL